MTFPTIYCIHLESREDRYEAMKKRFEMANILPHVKFVKAIPYLDSKLDYHVENLPCGPHPNYNVRAIYACLASHLKALRKFVKSNEKECFICEDDIVFRKNFLEEWQKISLNIPEDSPLVMLSYIVIQWNMKWGGIEPNLLNLCQMGIDNTWGTQMYLIRRDWAVRCLELFNRPFKNIEIDNPDEITSELITRKSNGLLIYPPLVIEDSAKYIHSSDLRKEIGPQSRCFAHWGVDNFDWP